MYLLQKYDTAVDVACDTKKSTFMKMNDAIMIKNSEQLTRFSSWTALRYFLA